MAILTDSANYSQKQELVLPLFYPHALAKFLQANGIAPQTILEGTQLTNESLCSLDTRISHKEHRRLITNAERAWAKPGLGLAFGNSLTLHSLGMIGQAARASRTLGETMDTITKYLTIRSPLLSYNWFREPEGTVYTLSGTRELGETERFMIEAGFAATKQFLTELAGKELSSIQFTFKRPSSAAAELYTHTLGTEVKHNQPSDSVFVPVKVARVILATRNQINAEEARRYCEAEIAQSGIEVGFKQIVYALLNSRLRNAPTESDTAVILGCSARSLRRRLAEQDTTFRELIQTARCDVAKKLLGSTHLSIEEIAHEIGYLNVGNFSRAFKTWTGLSPSVFRRQFR